MTRIRNGKEGDLEPTAASVTSLDCCEDKVEERIHVQARPLELMAGKEINATHSW